MDSRQPELSRLTLMCSDHEVAEFTWNHDRQAVTGKTHVLDAAHAPLMATDPSGNITRDRLSSWFKNRGIPDFRPDAADRLRAVGYPSAASLMASGFGASLSDQYWIRPAGSASTWRDVNCFENDFSEELAAAFAEAQEAAFGEAVLTVWAERIKSFKDSFIPVFGEACKDAACRFGFSKDGNNTFKSAVDAFAANICDLYGAAPQIVDGFCEFLARNACLEFDGYAADMPVPCQLYVAEGISKMAYQQAMNSVRGFKLDTDASVEFADKFINDNVTTPDSFIHLNDACIAIENVKAATSTPSVPEASVKFAVTQAAFEHKTVDHFDDALRPVYTDETDAEFEDAVDAAQGLDADATGIIARPDTDHPARPDEATSAPVQPETYRQDDYQDAYQGEGAGYARPETHGDIRGQYGPYGQDAYGSTYKQGY